MSTQLLPKVSVWVTPKKLHKGQMLAVQAYISDRVTGCLSFRTGFRVLGIVKSTQVSITVPPKEFT